MSRNLLASETSPYLLQHKNNPVHWRPWGAEALAEAERANKPVLVSVGYSACHWCHVMAHESFEDAETAAVMNENYICVKVDREERPDIDMMLQTSLNALGQSGGWPLTVFLTPKGEAFWGGTYFPKDAANGRPAFKSILNEVAELVRSNSDAVTQNRTQISQMLERIWNQSRAGGLSSATLNQAAVRVGQRYDMFFGGFQGAQKFPNTPTLELLWRAYLRTGLLQFLQLPVTTLDFMSQGGIYDHLGGGFARYSTDERWLVPHFEKMLYDNAQIVDMLMLVWQHGRQALYRQRIEETIGWVMREMMVEGSAFASSLDADSEGEEGKFYLWNEAEVDAALAGTFVQRFKDVYGVTREGNHNGKTVLNRLGSLQLLPDADEALLAKQRELLLAARERRVRPGRDDKVLTDWNALMIATLANAGAVFRRTEWTAAAIRAFKFVTEKMGEGDRLYHTYRAGKRQHPGFSDDYAFMARAAIMLWEMTGDRTALRRAEAWTRVLNEHFWDATFGGYCFTPDDGEKVKVRIRGAVDSQTPSANGVMAGVLARLYLITGQEEYRDRSNLLLQTFAGDLASSWAQMATYLNSFDFVLDATQIVIIGPANDGRTHGLAQAALGRSLPNRLLMVIEPGEKLPLGHPALGKTMVSGQPTAYLCRGNQCSPPQVSPVALSQTLLMQPPSVSQPRPAADTPVAGRA